MLFLLSLVQEVLKLPVVQQKAQSILLQVVELLVVVLTQVEEVVQEGL